MAEKKVLIIDDDPETLEIFGIELRNRGFQVQIAKNGIEGITVAKGFRPDIIISDLKMPGIDGINLTSKFKQNEDFKDIPFIIMSGYSSDDQKVNAENIGADGFLEKPVNFEHLTAKINNLLRKKSNESHDTNVIFSGVVSEMSILDVTQVLHQGRKTGILKIFTLTDTIGEIAYNKGEIFSCSYSPYFGTAAFYHLVRIDKGEFKLFSDEGRPLKNIWGPTNKLIMEAATNLDEFDVMDINNQLFIPVNKGFWIHGRRFLTELAAVLSGVQDIMIFENTGRILLSLHNNYSHAIGISNIYLNLSRMCLGHDSGASRNLFLLRMGKQHVIFHHLKANFVLCLQMSPETQVGVILTKIKKKITEISELIG